MRDCSTLPSHGPGREQPPIQTHRAGMTLLEVMLATVLVLGSVMALSRLAFLARKHAQSAEDRSVAQRHAQNIAEELAAGLRPLQAVSPGGLEGDWIYAVQVEALQQPGLASVTVIVDRLDDPEAMMPREDEMGGYRIVRWVRMQGRQVESEAAAEQNEGQPPLGTEEMFDEPSDAESSRE